MSTDSDYYQTLLAPPAVQRVPTQRQKKAGVKLLIDFQIALKIYKTKTNENWSRRMICNIAERLVAHLNKFDLPEIEAQITRLDIANLIMSNKHV